MVYKNKGYTMKTTAKITTTAKTTQATVKSLNSNIIMNEKRISVAKNEIEVSLKEIFNLVMEDLKNLKDEKLSKKQKLETLKVRYNVKNYSKKTLKAINSLIDYLLLGLNIDFNNITANDFFYIVTVFKKLQQMPTLKNGEINPNYIKGLEVIVTKKSLENCKTVKSYTPFIKEIKSFIKNYKQEKFIKDILATKGA